MNELDADKYLNTEPKRTKDLLEAENLKLKKELKELKMQYALQLIRAQELIDKILDTIQVDNVTKTGLCHHVLGLAVPVQRKLPRRAPHNST